MNIKKLLANFAIVLFSVENHALSCEEELDQKTAIFPAFEGHILLFVSKKLIFPISLLSVSFSLVSSDRVM